MMEKIVKRAIAASFRPTLERLESREVMTASSASSYLLPVASNFQVTALLTAGDVVAKTGGPSGATFTAAGIPDGLGAFDNGNGTFTVLVNHEIPSGQGLVRDHGGNGAFVDAYVIDKTTLQVLSGSDVMKQVFGWDSANQKSNAAPSIVNFSRFCSADLPDGTAFFNAATGLGTTERIFMHGEEGSSTGYQVGTVVTGTDAGKSYILGKFNLSTNGSGSTGVGAWENALANPFAQNKTVVIANSDGGTGIMNNALAVYVGTKTNTGSQVDKAGLTNGTLKFINVTGFADASGTTNDEINNTTTRTTGIANGTRFTLSGTASTNFSRPEDGVWNPNNPKEFYFNTTDQLDRTDQPGQTQRGGTRLWRLTFDDITNPDLGGKIDVIVDSTTIGGGTTTKPNMFDNITMDKQGRIVLLEDVGNSVHNGKVWLYDTNDASLTQILKHDPARFGDIGIAPTAPFTVDEESSGVLDVSSILGKGAYLIDVQDHHLTNDPATYEGGQLQLLRTVTSGISSFDNTGDPGGIAWYLRGTSDAGAPDVGPNASPFLYGGKGWRGAVGDWNGDSRVTIAAVDGTRKSDPTNAVWYLRNSNTPGNPDVTPFAYGLANWTPVAGDWAHTGNTGVGMFDPSSADGNGRWYLRKEANGGPINVTAQPIVFGLANYIPVVGDWDGTGTSKIGAFDPTTSTWYLATANAQGTGFTKFQFGQLGWKPVVGDWDGDGKTTIGAVDPSGVWHLRNANAAGADDIAPFAYGVSSWTPAAGRFASPIVRAGSTQPLLADSGAASAAPGATLDATALADIVSAALARLAAAGADPSLVTRLGRASYSVGSLPAGYLGAASVGTNQVVFSPDGAGRGWFVDSTPLQDEEFTPVAGSNSLTARSGSAAAGREDLLSAVLHEMGHLAGQGDDATDGLLGATLKLGARRTQALDAIFSK